MWAPFLLLLAAPAADPVPDPFEAWLDGAEHAADRFQPPVLQPGDWSVTGSGEQEAWSHPRSRTAHVLAVARGEVSEVTSTSVAVRHVFYENHHRREVEARFGGLARVTVQAGDAVTRGATVGVARGPLATFTVALVRDGKSEKLSEFVASAEPSPPPLDERVLVLVHHDSYRVQVFENGRLSEDLKIGFGQAKGRKRVQGDLMSPKGMYFVTKKHRGRFGGRWAAYYGGHWIKVSYPNKYDAAWGRARGLVTAKQEAAIAKAWEARALPPQNTTLGGGIGFHGWIEEWDDEQPHLSWGCMVLHLRDVSRVYDRIPTGAMVVLF